MKAVVIIEYECLSGDTQEQRAALFELMSSFDDARENFRESFVFKKRTFKFSYRSKEIEE